MRELKLSPHAFDKMTDLQFLNVRYIEGFNCFPQGLQSFPAGIKYLHWRYYPLKSLPEKYSAENLVILDLFASRVEKLWCGVKDLVNLIEVTLSYSKFLKELPDFSNATNLKILRINHCSELKRVHPSIFSLKELVHLDLSNCSSLTTFTSNSNLSSLHYLNLQFCIKLSEFSVSLENIVELDLSFCPINALPSSFGCQSKLKTLRLYSTEIESIPSSIKNLTRLRKLDIRRCSKLLDLPVLPSSVETLLVGDCGSLKTVLFPSTVAEQLIRVEFWNCLNLDESSVINIGLNVQINLMKYANFGYDQAVYVYPGSSVPEWFEYNTTNDDMIVDLSPHHLSSLLGFAFCFVLKDKKSPIFQFCDRLVFNITTIDVEGDGKKDGVDINIIRWISIVKSDHVCMVYDQQCSQFLTKKVKNQARFKIKVTMTFGFKTECPTVELKGFGVSPINQSTYQNFIQKNGI